MLPRVFQQSSKLSATLAGAALATGGIMANTTNCNADHIPSLSYGFDFEGSFSSFDYASVRRGYQVYKEVCATCHSLEGIAFRNLVNVTHTEAQMKELAAEIEVEDGPNDEGEMFDRPAKLSDKLPAPYANDEAGRAANNGALPPDLTLMTKARHGGADYVFALLTGYVEPPAGKVMLPGLHYNPYFSGGAIAMEKQLNDGQLEYEDGTPATASQLAKDVSVFLAWAAEPEHDERKLAGAKWLCAMIAMVCITGFYKRYRWNVLKTRKINYTHQLN
jgi:ubiquinol-cytochrome c reductase cytochrome c1 subunit